MKPKALIFTALVAFSSVTHAWGPREQGALAGVAGLLLLQGITQPRVYVQPPYNYPPGYPPVINPRHQHTYRPIFKAVDVYIPECNCTRTFMVQIN